MWLLLWLLLLLLLLLLTTRAAPWTQSKSHDTDRHQPIDDRPQLENEQRWEIDVLDEARNHAKEQCGRCHCGEPEVRPAGRAR